MVLFFRTPAAGRLAQLPFLFVALVLLLAVQPLAARAQPGFAESKFAAIVMDADTGKILYAKNADGGGLEVTIRLPTQPARSA